MSAVLCDPAMPADYSPQTDPRCLTAHAERAMRPESATVTRLESWDKERAEIERIKTDMKEREERNRRYEAWAKNHGDVA